MFLPLEWILNVEAGLHSLQLLVVIVLRLQKMDNFELQGHPRFFDLAPHSTNQKYVCDYLHTYLSQKCFSFKVSENSHIKFHSIGISIYYDR